MEKTSWYKKKRDEEEDGEDEIEKEAYRKRRKGEEQQKEKIEGEKDKKEIQKVQTKAKAVILTPFTTNSELAKSLREAEMKLESLTGYKLKVVERSGSRLEDVLHRSDPWRGEDCGREMCLLCKTNESLKPKTAQNDH